MLGLRDGFPRIAAGARKLWVSIRATDMESQLRNVRIVGREIMARFV